MTRFLEKAFVEVSKLPDQEQEAIANRIFEELVSGRRWTEAFTKSGDTLAVLAHEALAEPHQGRAQLQPTARPR